MNKIFKVVWSKTKECYVVVSEVAKNNGGKKKALSTVFAALVAVGAMIPGQAGAISFNGGNSGGHADGDASIAIGSGWGDSAYANTKFSIAIGDQANATGEAAIALGRKAKTNGEQASIAIGNQTEAIAKDSTAVGSGSKSSGEYAAALGFQTKATANYATAIGSGARGYAEDSQAIGREAETSAGALRAIAIGTLSKSSANYATSLGSSAEATAERAIAVGYKSKAEAERAISVGNLANASKNDSIAVGNNSAASGLNASAVGKNSKASGQSAAAFGDTAQATNTNATAVGNQANASNTNTTAIGNETVASGGNATAIGHKSQATGDGAVAVGTNNKADYEGAAVGLSNTVTGRTSAAFGRSNTVTGKESFAAGVRSTASGEHNVAIGYQAVTDNKATVAIGEGSKADIADGVALGSNSATTAAAGVQGFDPAYSRANRYGGLSGTAQTSTLGAVAVGNGPTATRQITGLAAGKEDTDAVNVAQLRSVNLKYAGNSGNSDVLLDDGTLNIKGEGLLSTTANGTGITVKLTKGDDIANDNGKAKEPTNNGVATTQNVVQAINNSYWKATAGGNTDGTPSVGNVKPGTQVTYSAGDNLKVKQTIAANGDQEYKYSLNADLKGINSISNSTTGPTMTFGGNSINITGGTLNMGNNKITNVAPGTDDKDAVNYSQIKGLRTEVKAGTGITVTPSKGTDGHDIYTVSSTATGGAASTESVVKKAAATGDTNIADVSVAGGKAVNDPGAQYEVSVSKNAVKDAAREAVTVNNGGNTDNPITVTPTQDNTNHNTTYAVTFDGNKAAKQIPLTYKATNGTTTTADQTVKLDKGLNFTGGDYTTASVGADGKVTFDVNLGTAPTVTDGKPGVPGQAGAAGKDGIATVKTVVDTINNSGWKANAKANGGTLDGSSTATVVKPGDQVNFAAGKNLTVKQDLTGEHTYTYSLNKDLKDLTSVEIGGSTIKTDGDHITITSPDTNPGATPGATVTNKVANLGDEKHIKPDTYAVANDGSVTLKYVDGNGKDLTETTKITGIAKKSKVINGQNTTVEEGTDTTDNSVTYKVNVKGDLADISSITNGTGSGKISFEGDQVVKVGGDHPISFDGKGGYVTGLQNKDWDITNPTVVSGRAATEDQLKKVSDGFNNTVKLTGNSGATGTQKLNQNGGLSFGVVGADNGKYITTTASGSNVVADLSTDAKAKLNSKVVVAGSGAATVAAPTVTTNADGSTVTTYTVHVDPATATAASTESVVKKAVTGDTNIADVSVADGKATGDVGAKYEVSVSRNAVKDAAREAVTVNNGGTTTGGTYTADTNNPITVNTVKDDTNHNTTYEVKFDGAKAAKVIPLTYKANGNGAKTVTLEKGLDFTNGTNTTAEIDNEGVVKYNLNKDVDLSNTGSLTVGGTTVNNGGITIKAPTTPGTTTTDVKLTNTGLDNGGNKITNVAEGTNNTDAVNVKQLKANRTEVKAGDNVVVTSAVDATDNHTIYTVNAVTPAVYTTPDGEKLTKDKDGKFHKVGETAEYTGDIITSFENPKAAAGQTTKDGGMIVNNVGSAIKNQTGATYLDKLKEAADANSNVKNAVVNVSDLKNTSDAIIDKGLRFDANEGNEKTNKLGSKVTVQGTGTLTAGKAYADEYNTANIRTKINQDSDGNTTINVGLAKALKDINSISNGASSITLNSTPGGATNTPAVQITGGNLSMGDGTTNNKIVNLAPGTDGTDAVNLNQLKGMRTVVTSTDKSVTVTSNENSTTGQVTYDLKVATTGTVSKSTWDLKSGVASATEGTHSGDTTQTIADTKSVTMQAGKNLTVKQTNDTAGNASVAYSLDKDISVETVTVTGQNGKDGKIGIDGKDGVDGKDGKNRVEITVEKGAKGVDGTDGHDGVNGHNGKDGMTRIVYEDKGGKQEVATLNDGLKFTGNNESTVNNHKLNTLVKIQGEGTKESTAVDPATGKKYVVLSDGTTKFESAKDNIAVEADGTDTLTVKLNKNLKGLDSVQTKTVVLGNPDAVNGTTNITYNPTDKRIEYVTPDTAGTGTTTNKVANLDDEKHIKAGSYAVQNDGSVTMTYVDGNNKDVPNDKAIITGIAKQNLSNIDNAGKTVITGLGTIVKAGDNVTVSEAADATTGQKTYTVNAVTPAIYTDKNGNKVVKRPDGTYTTNLDGSTGNDVAANDVIVSFKDAAGNTTGGNSIINNVGSAIKNQTPTMPAGVTATYLDKLKAAADDTKTQNAAVNVSDLHNTANALRDNELHIAPTAVKSGSTEAKGGTASGNTIPGAATQAYKYNATTKQVELTFNDGNGNAVADTKAVIDLSNLPTGGDMSSFHVTSSAESTTVGTHAGDTTQEIKDGKSIDFQAGKNMTVTQTNNNGNTVINYALDKNLDVESVHVGKDGKDGKIGIDGKDGVDGLNGTNRVDIHVEKGAKGVDGTDGHDGVNGHNGKDGMTRIVYEDKGGKQEVATLNDGLKFTGNNESTVNNHKLNTLVKVQGEGTKESATADPATGKKYVVLSDGTTKFESAKDNIAVEADSIDTLTVKLNKNLKGLNSIQLGDNTIKSDGDTIKFDTKNSGTKTVATTDQLWTIQAGGVDVPAKSGKVNLVAGDHITITPDAANGKMTISATGFGSMDGFNVKTSADANGTHAGDTTENIKNGKTVDMQAGKNLVVTQSNDGNGNTTVNYALNKDVNLGNDGSLKTGDTTIDNDGFKNGNTTVGGNGMTIKDPTDPTKTVSLTKDGLNNGGNQITNVASGGNVDTNAANIGDIKRLAKDTRIKDGTYTVDNNGTVELTYVDGAGNQVKDASGNAITAKITGLTTLDSTRVNVAVNETGSGKAVGSTTPVKVTKGTEFVAGNNLIVERKAHTGNDLDNSVVYSLNSNLTGISSISNTTNGPKMTIGSNDINFTGGDVKISDGNLDMNNNKITNVANGTDPHDAVNVSQLKSAKTIVEAADSSVTVTKDAGAGANGEDIYKIKANPAGTVDLTNVNNRVDQLGEEIGRVGAQGAALSALKPIQYDPLEPTQIMAGYGNYRGNSAVALGVAHYKNESTLIHGGVSWAGGSSHMMANAGVTWKVGNRDSEAAVADRYRKGPISSAYAMQQEMAAMKAQNAGLKGEVSDLKAENEQMKAQIAAMMAKLGL